MRTRTALLFAIVFCIAASAANSEKVGDQDWTNYVRIAAYSLTNNNAEKIVNSAAAGHVFGIEVDNDITGRYESFLDPTEKLKAIQAVAAKAHRVGNHAFVYIAGTECITANAADVRHTLAKDHPDWLQRKVTGEPAIFGGGSAFWIKKGDEDVWISPFATEWRTLYMQRVRQIAATGIDGIYVDIPYWMTHFDGWEDSWASFDDYTVAAFKKETGLDSRRDLKLGDFADENFRKWVNFRIRALTDFVAEIDRNAKAINPRIKTIPEIYPGIEQEAARVGADVYQMYPVVDAIAHEYEFGGGDHMASSRTPLDWFKYQVGMYSFRAFAEGKATWMLNYSWDGDKHVDPRESMKNLAMSEIMAGANFWDARGHMMSGSNDLPTRSEILKWIKEHEKTFYSPRQPIDPIGIYFSPATRNYFAEEFLQSYRGVLILLLQKHWEFQVVTPRTLSEFRGRTLVLPDVRILDDDERKWMAQFAVTHTLVVTGHDATALGARANVVRFSDSPGKAYLAALEKDFAGASPETQREFLQALEQNATLKISASPWLATDIARVNGKPHVFFANFKGLRPKVNAVQSPETGATIKVQGRGRGFFLPFLGAVQQLVGEWDGVETTYKLPPIHKGGVAWVVSPEEN
ncbi:MAG: hypothetical protein JWN45_49 [Acidobacteriaceae bacterium]|nr:hypothetical protein [Acidobacteriaceae bacterium]